MDETLDKIFDGPQESYEDLVGKFLFLSHNNDKPKQNGYHHGTETRGLGSVSASSNVIIDEHTETEEIPVEELGTGFSIAPSMVRALESESTLIPKIGNYVDSDVSDLSSLSDCSDAEEYQCTTNITERSNKVDKEPCHANTSAESVTVDQQISASHNNGFDVLILNNVHSFDPLPGEASINEQESFDNQEIQITNLEIKTKIKKKTNLEENEFQDRAQQDSKAECDQVEAFELDENFDYDNMELTPKYWDTDIM